MRTNAAVAVLDDPIQIVKSKRGCIRVESPAVKDALRTLARNSQSSKWALTAQLENVVFLEAVDVSQLGGAAQAVLAIAQQTSADVYAISTKLEPIVDLLVAEGDLNVTMQCLSLLETDNAHLLLIGAFRAGATRYANTDAVIATAYQLAITDSHSSRCALNVLGDCGIPDAFATTHMLFREIKAQSHTNSPVLALT